VRLTDTRRRVLEILLEDHRALGAYAILDRLRDEGLGAQPPVAYRALDFLVRHGLAHRIEHLNAFVACAHPGRGHAPIFLICRSCAAVAEAPAAPVMAALGSAAQDAGFAVDHAMVEAEGLCPACQGAGQGA
jgi:Fur family zinc uptake transcriptional regulator